MLSAQGPIISYYDEQSVRITDNWEPAVAGAGHEAIHQFRLSVKRFHALFQLLEFISGHRFEAKVAYKRFRKPFKICGRIRDRQVLRSLITRYEEKMTLEFEELKEILEKRENDHRLELRTSMSHDIKESLELTRSEILQVFEEIDTDLFQRKAAEWVTGMMMAMSGLLDEIEDPRVFHRFRRYQKDTIYMIDFINNFTTLKIGTAIPLDEIKDIAYDIGQWHDLHNLALFIEGERPGHFENTTTENGFLLLSEALKTDMITLFNTLKDRLSVPGMFEVSIS